MCEKWSVGNESSFRRMECITYNVDIFESAEHKCLEKLTANAASSYNEHFCRSDL